MDGGSYIAEVLKNQGVEYIFTLCGGHISNILIQAHQAGIKVIDGRHEANAVFAADAYARLSGRPGIAVVTAGPGVTNAITGLVNSDLSQSPLILIGGAAATLDKGRGALQDIDQLSIMKPVVKWATSLKTLDDIIPKLEKAFQKSQEGVPGPVFIECPVDVNVPEPIVRAQVKSRIPSSDTSLGDVLKNPLPYLKKPRKSVIGVGVNEHYNRVFRTPTQKPLETVLIQGRYPRPQMEDILTVERYLNKSERPMMIVGSQAVINAPKADELAKVIQEIGIPTYFTGMARGLLGKEHKLQMRHERTEALKEADVVLLAGMPADFRLGYGTKIKGHSTYIAINRSNEDFTVMKTLDRRPDSKIIVDPAEFLMDLNKYTTIRTGGWDGWVSSLKERDAQKEQQMRREAEKPVRYGMNPLKLLFELDDVIQDDSYLIADGGDFVSTASYVLRPSHPLRWLDPGRYGTLGVGGGFATAAKAFSPESEVWMIWGDGSCAYSIAEYETYARQGLPVIAVVGNDGGWSQIGRDQVRLLGDDLATKLRYADYHTVAKGYSSENGVGGGGMRVETIDEFKGAVREAREYTKKGMPYLINAIITPTDFREGSLSV